MSTCGEDSDSWATDDMEEESDLEEEYREDGGGFDNDFYSYPLPNDQPLSESDYCDTEDEENTNPGSGDASETHGKTAALGENCTDHVTKLSDAENGSGDCKDISKKKNVSSGVVKEDDEEEDNDEGEEEDDNDYIGDVAPTEVCLISATKAPDMKILSPGCESRGTQTEINYLELMLYEEMCRGEFGGQIPERDWYTLTDLIFNRDGKGILRWVKERNISERTKKSIAKAVDSPLKIAIRAGSVPIFNYFAGEGFPFDPVCHPFFEATREGSLPHLKSMLDFGVDINVSNDESMTALHLAAREPYDYSFIIQFLVAHGANVNSLDRYGSTPLFRAVMSGSDENIIALIAAGSPMNVQNYEGRPLLHAGVCRGFKTVKWLYRAGARPGISPIYDEVRAAIRERQVNTFRYLIRKNAPFRIKSFKENLTSLCHVITCQDQVKGSIMLDMLLAAGYDVSAEPDIEKLVPAQFRGKKGHALRKKINSYLTEPRSLKELACFKVRKTHGTSLPDLLKTITLCPVLKKYLQLKHL